MKGYVEQRCLDARQTVNAASRAATLGHARPHEDLRSCPGQWESSWHMNFEPIQSGTHAAYAREERVGCECSLTRTAAIEDRFGVS